MLLFRRKREPHHFPADAFIDFRGQVRLLDELRQLLQQTLGDACRLQPPEQGLENLSFDVSLASLTLSAAFASGARR